MKTIDDATGKLSDSFPIYVNGKVGDVIIGYQFLDQLERLTSAFIWTEVRLPIMEYRGRIRDMTLSEVQSRVSKF